MKSLHPFPARMAPEIALDSMKELSKGSIVLDPMTGSGTVLRQAVAGGHKAIGYDMDPLAVMMSKVGTTPVDFKKLEELFQWVIDKADSYDKVSLPWIDNDPETKKFIRYWFAAQQIKVLRKLAYVLYRSKKLQANSSERDVLKLAFSRLIITKKVGASLAWDVSHSRPHKVSTTNDFDVRKGFERSYNQLKNILSEQKMTARSAIHRGDARNMTLVKKGSVDAVITSPPYLNAIDYLRGHKLALVWLGYQISEIRSIRGESIGVERQNKNSSLNAQIETIIEKLNISKLPARQIKMVERYTYDACLLMKEVARVLKPSGKAVFVVGDSCLKDVFIENSKIFSEAAKNYKLTLSSRKERELPIGSRYLPLPKDSSNALSKRMKTEVILEFAHG